MRLVERLEPGQAGLVDVDGPGTGVHRPQAEIEGECERRALHRDDLLEDAQGFPGDVLAGLAELQGQTFNLLREARAAHDFARHLLAPDQRGRQDRVELEQLHAASPGPGADGSLATLLTWRMCAATCCGSSYIGTCPAPLTTPASAPRTRSSIGRP